MANGKTVSPADEICSALEAKKGDFSKALPPQIPSARFIRVAQTAIRVKPSLGDLDRASLYAAFHDAAAQGLLPDNREGAIVPFKGKAKFMPMVAGILKKARNSGEIGSIGCQVVYEKDTYRAWEDEKGQHFEFERSKEDDRGKPIVTYAYAITKDGALYFEEISEVEMQKIKAMARADDSPWKGPFEDEMRKKSTLRRLFKYRVPSSTDLDDVIRADDDLYALPTQEKLPVAKQSSRLRDVVDTTAAPETHPQPAGVKDDSELPI